MKYTLADLAGDFPTDQACLLWLFEHRYGDCRAVFCPSCSRYARYYPLKSKQAFSCANCRHHIFPMQGTIFQGSTTPLKSWFHAIYMLSTNKAGISAKQLERELGVTYKTAWRMNHKIRSLMAETGSFQGEVEIDECYIHPNPFKRSSARRRYGMDARRKGPVVFGIVERGGSVRVWQVKSTGARTLLPIIKDNVQAGSTIHTDGYLGYRSLGKQGYRHYTTDHGANQYYTADSSTQNIENVWSHFKRGVKGVYRHIGEEYVQAYASEYAFRYSHRNDESMFWSLLLRL